MNTRRNFLALLLSTVLYPISSSHTNTKEESRRLKKETLITSLEELVKSSRTDTFKIVFEDDTFLLGSFSTPKNIWGFNDYFIYFHVLGSTLEKLNFFGDKDLGIPEGGVCPLIENLLINIDGTGILGAEEGPIKFVSQEIIGIYKIS